MTSKKQSAKKGETTWTLTQTAVAYLESLRAAKKSESTVNAYAADLDLATGVLGAETPIATLTLDDVARFNASEPVLRTKSGRDKAMPTIERSRRVLRLALVFAEQQGAIDSAPIPAKKRESKPVEEEPAPAPKKTSKRAKTDVPLSQREAIGLDDERNKPVAAEDDLAQIAYASTGEPVSA